jgi:hypothetical protein
MGLFDKQVKRTGKGLFSIESDPYDTSKVDTQIQNAQTRIQDAGYQPADSDQRNWFEKATNLPQHQNWFFDTLELLGRGGNAVKNTIDKSFIKGQENPEIALWKGLSGQEKVNGADLAQEMGINNKIGKFALGTALDIGLDPTTYIPGGVLAKGVGAVAKPVGSVLKAGYDALEAASPALKTLRETRLQPAAESFKDGLGYMFNPDYKITQTLDGGQSDVLKNLAQSTENQRRIMQEDTLRSIGTAARDAGGIDTGEAAGRIMEAPLRQFEDVKAYEFPDGLTRTENKGDLQAAIDQNRSAIKGTGKELSSQNREYQQAIGEFSKGLDQTDAQIRKLYMGLERNAGKEVDAATRQNIREASRELARVDSQINNFGQNETSALRYYKKQVRQAHESNFDLIKKIKETAPKGIKASGFEIPNRIKNLVSAEGKGIDEVASELGYQYADDLLQDVKHLDSVPRKLSDSQAEEMARKEMERAGVFKQLEEHKQALTKQRENLYQAIRDVKRGAKSTNAAKATEKAFADLSEHPEYQRLSAQRNTLKAQYDAIKGESKQAHAAKLEQIKNTEADIEALRESMKNPVMVQKELPRPQRELSADPKIQQAAKTLNEKNAEIRQLAEENGISIPELEGYMTHILSQEERTRRKVVKPVSVDRGANGTGNPNKSILKNRELTGSVEDINDKTGRKFFEPNAYFATAIGQKRLIDYIHAVTFRRQVLSNPDFARPFYKGMEVPKDTVVIDSNHYTFLKDSGDSLDGVVQKEEIGGQYLVTKQAKQLLDRYQRLNTDEGTKAFLKAFDSIQSFWKRGTLFSLGYHIRNMAGALFNNYVGGMNSLDLVKYTSQATNDVQKALRGQESKLFREYREQGLGSSSLSNVEFAKAGEEPEKAVEKTVKKLSRTTLGQKVKDKVFSPFETSREIGDTMDQVNRFALYKWAKDKGMSPEQAAAKVREVQFDYSKLTPFEQNVVVRVLPFYRWMKNNIPFQIRQFINDPRKYGYMNKARLNAQDVVGLDENNVPDYMKESFAVPIYGNKGKGKFLGLNLPLGDLTKLSTPGKTLVDSFTPILKTPAELALNYNMFRGKPIEQFAGQQKQYQIGNMKFGIGMKPAYAIEQATGQIGRGLSGFLQKPESVNQDNTIRLPALGISSLTKPFDAQQYQYYDRLNELRQLQDLINYIQQQEGAKPRTIAEIKKGSR